MDGYEAVRKTTGWRDRSADGRLRVTGADRAAWLQGLLTNDIAALKPGDGCYAAYLTPQGRMISDVRVLARADHMLLDVPASQKAAVLERLSTFIIMEDVAIEDATDTIARLALHGPASASLLASIAGVDVAALGEHANVEARVGEQSVLIAGSRDLGVIGFDVYGSREMLATLRPALIEHGAEHIDDEAWHTLRIEAGRPLFGVDMTTDTIPLEAGIEDRAISFTKGCYVGQEIIIRVMHRGGGRVARKLVGLRADGAVIEGAAILSGDRSIGQVTSAAHSPRLDAWIAMGYVHRDFADDGTTVTVGNASARVTKLPVDLI